MVGYESQSAIQPVMYANPSLTNKTTDRHEDEFIYTNIVDVIRPDTFLNWLNYKVCSNFNEDLLKPNIIEKCMRSI
jgi:hypothetical protein